MDEGHKRFQPARITGRIECGDRYAEVRTVERPGRKTNHAVRLDFVGDLGLACIVPMRRNGCTARPAVLEAEIESDLIAETRDVIRPFEFGVGIGCFGTPRRDQIVQTVDEQPNLRRLRRTDQAAQMALGHSIGDGIIVARRYATLGDRLPFRIVVVTERVVVERTVVPVVQRHAAGECLEIESRAVKVRVAPVVGEQATEKRVLELGQDAVTMAGTEHERIQARWRALLGLCNRPTITRCARTVLRGRGLRALWTQPWHAYSPNQRAPDCAHAINSRAPSPIVIGKGSVGFGVFIAAIRGQEPGRSSETIMTGNFIQSWRAVLGRSLGQFDLAFEPVLEAEFERATVRARRQRFRRIGFLQLVMTHIGAIGLYALLDNATVVILATLAVDLFSLGCLVILRRKPDVFVRESVMMAGVLCWVLMAETVSLYAERPYLWIIQTAIALQPFLMAAGIQLRFSYCVTGCIATVATVALGNALFSTAAPAEQFWMALVQTVAAIYALFGCWRLEERERANYRAIRESEHNARELDRANAHLARLTHHDEMTGVLNRRGLRRALAEVPGGCARAVILVDVDYFKRYNDHYGHLAGDRCLCRVARALADTLAATGDVLARWGGEEFLVIVDADTPEPCAELAARMQTGIRELAIAHEASPVGAVVSISAGYAVASVDAGDGLDELVHRADQALYAAKQAGRNCVRAGPAEIAETSGHRFGAGRA